MNDDTDTREGCGTWLAKTLLYLLLLFGLLLFAAGGGLAVIAPLPGA